LVVAGLPGRLTGGRPRHCGLPGVAFASVQALRWLKEISFCDLTLMKEPFYPCALSIQNKVHKIADNFLTVQGKKNQA
jgi:hypothetical protein